MPRYVVKTREVHEVTWFVKANDLEQAVTKAHEGNASRVHRTYEYTLTDETTGHEVEEQKA